MDKIFFLSAELMNNVEGRRCRGGKAIDARGVSDIGVSATKRCSVRSTSAIGGGSGAHIGKHYFGDRRIGQVSISRGIPGSKEDGEGIIGGEDDAKLLLLGDGGGGVRDNYDAGRLVWRGPDSSEEVSRGRGDVAKEADSKTVKRESAYCTIW